MTVDKLTSFENVLKESSDISIITNDFPEKYTLGGSLPELLIKPETVEQLQLVLKTAHEQKTGIIPFGGGTRINSGIAYDNYKAAMDLTSIDSIIEYDPEEFLAIVSPGITIDNLNTLLAKDNRFLPLNPPQSNLATAGGVIASNSYGFLHEAYGTARDMTLGLKFLLPDGTLIKAGGKVAKNVAGYDLTKLMIGSWGTLGIITEISFRIKPLPEYRCMCAAGFNDVDSAVKSAYETLDSFFLPAFMIIIDRSFSQSVNRSQNINLPENNFILLAGIENIKETADWQSGEIKRVCNRNNSVFMEIISGDNENILRESLREFVSEPEIDMICKISTTRTGSEKVLRHFEINRGLFNDMNAKIYSMFGSGINYILFQGTENLNESDFGRLRDELGKLMNIASESGGFLTIEKVPVGFINEFNFKKNIPGEVIMNRIKQQFDPDNILPCKLF